LSLEESLYDIFQPETLEGENAYWCDTCQTTCRATKTLSYTRNTTILIIHSKRLILLKKIQNHIPFDTTLDLEPYMTPGHSLTHDMKLVGIISHHGTKDNGHYTAMTKRADKWTLYNDAITTQTTMKHLHQTQAQILMYRKTGQRTGMGKPAPTDIPKKMESQSRAKGNLNPRPEAQQERETPAPQLEFLTQSPPGQNLPRRGSRDGGANPVHGARSRTENQRELDTLSSTHAYIPLVPETKNVEDGGGTRGGSGERVPSTRREDEKERPFQQEEKSDQFPGELVNLLQSISIFFQLSQGRIEELTSLLSELSGTPITMEMTRKWLDLEPQMKKIPYDSRTKDLIEALTEDPEDNPDGFIPIIELHNARLQKTNLLHAAISAIIQQKWVEDTDLEDIGKFLQSWALEPYRDKPMPKGMIQALLGIAPDSQEWAPTDLSKCIFRNTEAADSIDELVRTLKSLGTAGGPAAQDSIKRTPEEGSDLVRIFPPMRSLHDTRRDWLSDKELWLAIPEGETQIHCLTHAPRHTWKLIVEFFLALNTNIGSWIQNLERRDMMLLGSLAENIFGFTGAYVRKKQASLAPILTGWKRWIEFNTMIDDKMPRTGWILNFRMSGSISTNKVEKALSWNVGPHGYKGSKEEIYQIFEQGPPIICLQDVRIAKRRKNSVKRELQNGSICPVVPFRGNIFA